MHSAIVRSYATSDHDYTRTVAYMHQVVLRIPQPRCCHLHQALQWVKRHRVWAHHSYASWRLPHHVSVDGATGDLCTDHATLFQHWMDIVPAGHVCVCVCDTTLARCSNMSRKNPNVPSFPIPILSDHAVVNIGTSLTPLLIRCGQCAQLALK